MTVRDDGYGGFTVGPSGSGGCSDSPRGFDRLTWALETACRVHRGQTDKGGVPYIEHILAVREAVRPHGEEAMIVATLHDAVEDFDGTPLGALGLLREIRVACGDEVFDAVNALTKQPGEDYEGEYLDRVAVNFLARVVKIADLTNNMDPRRIPAGQIVDKDFERWAKYRRALIRLERS